MAEILRTPEECALELETIILDLKDLAVSLRGDLTAVINRAANIALMRTYYKVCGRIPYRLVSVSTLERTARINFVSALFDLILRHGLLPHNLIRPFVEELSATNLDIALTNTYADDYPEVVIELIESRAELEEIPVYNVRYIIDYSRELAKTPKEFSAFLMFSYYYMSEHLELPVDLLDNIGYYLQMINTLFQHQVLMRLSLRSLLKTVNQAMEVTIPYVVSYAVLTENRELIDTIYQLMLVDPKHKKLLDELEEHGILTEDEYEENIMYLTHIQSILKDLSLFTYVIRFIKYRVSIDEERILERWTKRLKERITGRPREFTRTTFVLYSVLYDRVTFTKNAIEYLLYQYHKVVRYTTITVFEKVPVRVRTRIRRRRRPRRHARRVIKTRIKRLYPFRKLYPFGIAHYIINAIFIKLPEIQPLRQPIA